MGRVPWCTSCDRFLSPSSVTTAGDCPRCGTPVDPGRARAATSEPAIAAAPESESYVPDLKPVPWHLKLLAGAVALYLGWRAFQGIEWVVHRF
jgi:hypothetical protein